MKLTRRKFLLGSSAIVIGAVGLSKFTPESITAKWELPPLPPGKYDVRIAFMNTAGTMTGRWSCGEQCFRVSHKDKYVEFELKPPRSGSLL